MVETVRACASAADHPAVLVETCDSTADTSLVESNDVAICAAPSRAVSMLSKSCGTAVVAEVREDVDAVSAPDSRENIVRESSAALSATDVLESRLVVCGPSFAATS